MPICESMPELLKKPKEPTKHKNSKLKLQQKIMNEIIDDKKDTNNDIFWKYFQYQNPSFLAKDLIKANHAKNEQLVTNIDDGFVDLRNVINRKEIPEIENPDKIIDIAEKTLFLINNKNGEELKY